MIDESRQQCTRSVIRERTEDNISSSEMASRHMDSAVVMTILRDVARLTNALGTSMSESKTFDWSRHALFDFAMP